MITNYSLNSKQNILNKNHFYLSTEAECFFGSALLLLFVLLFEELSLLLLLLLALVLVLVLVLLLLLLTLVALVLVLLLVLFETEMSGN